LLLGDVTGDRRPDLVARDPSVTDGTLWVYPHDGSTHRHPWSGPRESAGTGWNLATAMLLGDLTGDGGLDLVVRDRAGDLWIYPHDGSASGNPWTAPRSWAGTGWNTARALALGDVAGDGRPDLVDLESDGSLWIYVTGSEAGPTRVPGDWTTTTRLALGDVSGTGRLDLVALDANGELWVHPHDGSTAGNPWPTRRSVGSDWGFASALLL
jgi:FG-GAP-like repeat